MLLYLWLLCVSLVLLVRIPQLLLLQVMPHVLPVLLAPMLHLPLLCVPHVSLVHIPLLLQLQAMPPASPVLQASIPPL